MKNIKILFILMLLLVLTGCSKKEYSGEINVLNWSSYIPDEVIDEFEEKYNIKVNYGTYSSNEELLAKIANSKTGTYDIIFPSDYMVELMKEKGYLEKIDKSKISNYSNISELFLNQEFDKNNEYSIPFLMATTLIAYNSDKIKDNITSYNDLLDSKYKDDIVVLEDQRIMIGTSNISLGYDFNEINPTKLNEAKNWFLKLKKNVKAFDSDSPKNFLITGEADIGIVWSAEGILAKNENDAIKLVYPAEGHALSLDNFTILKGSKNIDNAYLFINYLLEYEVNKKITDSYPYIGTLNNYSLYSYDELSKIISTGKYVKNIGSNISLYDKLWAEVK